MATLLPRVLQSIVTLVLLLVSPAEQPNGPELMIYDFELYRGPVGNVELVRSLGFDGIVTRVANPPDLVKLSDYADHVETIEGFDLIAFFPYDFTNPASPQVWRDALPILARVESPLWVIVRGAPSDVELRQLLTDMANESLSFGVSTVIYPHWDTSIESAAEAADLMRDIGHVNLANSLHTCHEIRAGNQASLDTVVSRYVDRSTLVTIAGAEVNAYAGPVFPGATWDDAIMPLDQGAFSLLPFLQELHDSGYDGPVVLHTFGITDDRAHRWRSLREYGRYLEQIVP